MSTVLVTGGSGFIGSHAIIKLLGAGHTVRTTVRNLSRESEVRAMLKVGGVDAGERLTFFAADLEKDAGWAEAVRGCEFVLHVASPLPASVPKNEDELIVPAREGTLRVLRAARDAGVKRVVVTSSFAAIGYGHAASQSGVHGERLDRPERQRRDALPEIEDAGGAGGVGLYRERGRGAGTGNGESGGGVRAGAGAGFSASI